MEAHHAELEARVRALRQPLDAGDLQSAMQGAAALSVDMMQHMREEEERVFPLVASRLLMVRPISVLQREHRALAAQLRELCEAVDSARLLEARRVLDDLLAVLELHHRREMDGLYGWMDRLLSADARGGLIRRLKGADDAVPES